MSNFRERLAARNKGKLTPVDLEGLGGVFIMPITVGVVDKIQAMQRAALSRFKEDTGADADKPEQIADNYSSISDMTPIVASVLCDENGVLIFDPESQDDLKWIKANMTAADIQAVMEVFNSATQPKNSQSESDSNSNSDSHLEKVSKK